jgi:hypothetical protein
MSYRLLKRSLEKNLNLEVILAFDIQSNINKRHIRQTERTFKVLIPSR